MGKRTREVADWLGYTGGEQTDKKNTENTIKPDRNSTCVSFR